MIIPAMRVGIKNLFGMVAVHDDLSDDDERRTRE